MFLDLLATFLRTLNINILAVTCVHVYVSVKFLHLSRPFASKVFHHTADMEGLYLSMVTSVHGNGERIFLAAGAWLLVLQDCSDTGVTKLLFTAGREVWLPSNMHA